MNRIEKIKESIKSIDDVIAIAKPSEEEMALINYSGDNTRMIGAKNNLLLQMVADVFNTNENGVRWEPNWKDYSQRKWYPWFNMDANTPSGVGFSSSYYAYWHSFSSVGSRLCFENEKLSYLSAELFPEIYIALLKK